MIRKDIEFLESILSQLSGIESSELTKAEKNISRMVKEKLNDLYSILSEDD